MEQQLIFVRIKKLVNFIKLVLQTHYKFSFLFRSSRATRYMKRSRPCSS
ncbi:hypothetical protein HanPSC8_Chr16g0736991 [Helianthus annuus]|nr:hypothetical protein HanPSC8_Chr16g0736991 [Helianthus annuus]